MDASKEDSQKVEIGAWVFVYKGLVPRREGAGSSLPIRFVII